MSLQEASDEDLMTGVRQHEEEALQELLRRYHTRLGRFAYSVLRRRDLAEEAVANVFIGIWRRRETLAIKSSVRSYLFAAVGNQSLNLRKSQLKAGTVGLDEVPARQLADARSSDSAILFREFHAEVDAMIRQMPPQRQLVFRMNRFEGLRYGEIAAALGLSEHTVQNHMVQAMKQLALELPRLKKIQGRNSTVNPFG